jgi:hypothetical protein
MRSNNGFIQIVEYCNKLSYMDGAYFESRCYTNQNPYYDSSNITSAATRAVQKWYNNSTGDIDACSKVEIPATRYKPLRHRGAYHIYSKNRHLH